MSGRRLAAPMHQRAYAGRLRSVHFRWRCGTITFAFPIHSYTHNIAIGPNDDSHLSEDADMVLFDLKQVERKLSLRHLLKECRLRARGAVRFYMRALLIDDLIQRGDVCGEQGINTTLLNCCHGV